MIPCSRFEYLLDAYCEGELHGKYRLLLEDHLDRCPRCAALARDLVQVIAILRSLPDVPARFDIVARVLKAIEAPGWRAGSLFFVPPGGGPSRSMH